jgi:uncharacterized membrane protein YgcG
MLKAILTSALLGLAVAAHAAQPVPPFPEYYVLDHADLLSQKQQQAIGTILIEHDHATREQIVVALFRNLPKEPEKEEPSQHARRVFEEWKIGKRGIDSGALLAFYAEEKKARIESGIGLHALDEDQGEEILKRFFAPEIRSGDAYRALSLTVLEILRTVESPLIETGRAEQLVREGGIEGPLRPIQAPIGTSPTGWIAFLAVGAILFGFVIYNVLAAEAHFTGEGWFRPNPWKLLTPKAFLDRRRAPRLNAGGVHGSW